MRNVIRIAAGVLAASVFSGSAIAQTTPEVTVSSAIVLATTTERTYTGIPILNVSLSYGVSAAGLDLASHRGALELESRVSGAALAACKELGRQYPDSTPKDGECAKTATDKAMVKVHELEAAAGARSAGK